MLGSLLKWRHARTLLQIPLFMIAVAMILHGLFGPQLAPKNLATTLTWVHFRGALVLVLLFAGNFFCLACPFMLCEISRASFFVRCETGRGACATSGSRSLVCRDALCLRVVRSVGVAVVDRVADRHAYFAGALLIDSIFKHATFCKFVCPIGQFNFVAATVSPFEVAVRDHDVCTQCATKDCIRGVREPKRRWCDSTRL
jgi:polyferredoxin